MKSHDEKSFAQVIKDTLKTRAVKRITDEQGLFKHAGVLIPLLVQDGICQILFTKRTEKVEHHKGQISFPGGAVDEEDASIRDTVLREVEEEIGLKRQHIEILGRIDDALTMVSNFIIHPFVGLLPFPYRFTINKEEVEKLITVPIQVFDPENPGGKGRTFEFEGKIYRTPTFEYQNEVIWGATARIIENFMDMIKGKLQLLHKIK